jgi:hypothetical protein
LELDLVIWSLFDRIYGVGFGDRLKILPVAKIEDSAGFWGKVSYLILVNFGGLYNLVL